MNVLLLVLVALVAQCEAAMAGTRAASLRRPVLHKGASGMTAPARTAPTVEEAVAAARASKDILMKRAHTIAHAQVVDTWASSNAAALLEECIRGSSTAQSRDECEVNWEKDLNSWSWGAW